MVMIRPVTSQDAPEVAGLSAELGYAVTVDEMRRRIDSLSAQADHAVFVACLDSEVVGWIDVEETHHLAAGRRAEICGMVVASGMRSRGIGRELVAHAEQWAIDRGLQNMVVRSRESREAAHRFYLREGYSRTKTSAVFGKQLGS